MEAWTSDGITRRVIEDLGEDWLIEAHVPIDEEEKGMFLRLKVSR